MKFNESSIATLAVAAQTMEFSATSIATANDPGYVHVRLKRIDCAIVAYALRDYVAQQRAQLEQQDVPPPP